MPAFSAVSAQRLVGLHPDLLRVLKRAIQNTDFTVIEGVRSKQQCFINFGKGRNAAQCIAGGCPATYAQPGIAKVTWLNHALSCNHLAKGDGFGHAVDIAPVPIDWNDVGRFDSLQKVMFAAAAAEGVRLRWGGNWDQDAKPHEKGETDLPHFELVK